MRSCLHYNFYPVSHQLQCRQNNEKSDWGRKLTHYTHVGSFPGNIYPLQHGLGTRHVSTHLSQKSSLLVFLVVGFIASNLELTDGAHRFGGHF